MTQLELKEHFRDKLIPHYKLAIERCSERSCYSAMAVCEDMDTHNGICYCSYRHFGCDISGNAIIIAFAGDDGYWFKAVWEANSTPEILDLLQKRVDKMESIVQS